MAKSKTTYVHEQLSEHFNSDEFARSAMADMYGIDNTIPVPVMSCLRRLCRTVLEPLRVLLCQPVVISSGYRSARLNKVVGGVRTSQHLTGCAADISLPSKEYGDLVFQYLSDNPNVDQLLYEHSGGAYWIHVSISLTGNPRHIVNSNYVVYNGRV